MIVVNFLSFLVFFAITTLFQWETHVLFVTISKVISRTTWPNTGLFVLILMHFPCLFQMWENNNNNKTLLKKCWGHSCTRQRASHARLIAILELACLPLGPRSSFSILLCTFLLRTIGSIWNFYQIKSLVLFYNYLNNINFNWHDRG